jgi:hypothetical protein
MILKCFGVDDVVDELFVEDLCVERVEVEVFAEGLYDLFLEGT